MKAFKSYSSPETYRSWLAGHGFRIAGIGNWLSQFPLSGRVVIWEDASQSLAIVAFSEDVDAVACALMFSDYAVQ